MPSSISVVTSIDCWVRLIEGTLRSMNSVSEHLHQSFYYYLLSSDASYISIGQYVVSLGFLLTVFLLVCYPSFPPSGQADTFQEQITSGYSVQQGGYVYTQLHRHRSGKIIVWFRIPPTNHLYLIWARSKFFYLAYFSCFDRSNIRFSLCIFDLCYFTRWWRSYIIISKTYTITSN